MPTPTRLLAVFLMMLAGEGAARAADDAPPSFDVWPGAAPGEAQEIGPEKFIDRAPAAVGGSVARLTNVSKPAITLYRPPKEKDTGAAVLICPGGGYSILATDLEGAEVAAWLNSLGVTGIVLKYRVPQRKDDPRHLLPLQDAQRALSVVRARAKEWGLDPARIGMLGFSAGGNLTALACTRFDKRAYEPTDDTDRVSCRPDFAVLVYPAWLVQEGKTDLSPEIPVTAQSPPAFLVHAGDDKIKSDNSAAYYLALKRAGVPAELHVYATGGHGFGLRPSAQPVSSWPKRCEAWMKGQGVLGSNGRGG